MGGWVSCWVNRHIGCTSTHSSCLVLWWYNRQGSGSYFEPAFKFLTRNLSLNKLKELLSERSLLLISIYFKFFVRVRFGM